MVFGLTALLGCGCGCVQRKILFHPTHHNGPSQPLSEWKHEGRLLGYARQVPHPRNVWLLCHGNAGQASDRAYALGAFSPEDAVFILEYPGFGQRPGKPTHTKINSAATEAFQVLRATYPDRPLCVAGESIGTGPASFLASQPATQPAKVVLIVPFDTLKSVGADHAPGSLARLVLHGTWNNVETLSMYHGPVEIFAAREDTIIPPRHAQALAASVPQSVFHLIDGEHNEWATPGRVTIRNP
jgi:pimeloyl-ACP methyl ester carboxylesterase